MSRQSGKIDYGATGISYTISRSEVRKTIAVTVHPDGTVSARPKASAKVRLEVSSTGKQGGFFTRRSTSAETTKGIRRSSSVVNRSITLAGSTS